MVTDVVFVQLAVTAIVLLAAILVLPSIRIIGPTQIGLVTKRFGLGHPSETTPPSLT